MVIILKMLNLKLLNKFKNPILFRVGFLLFCICVQNVSGQVWQLMPGTKTLNNRLIVSSINNDSLIVCSSIPFISGGKDIVLNKGTGFMGIGQTTSGSAIFMKKVRNRNLLCGAHWGIIGCPNNGTGLGNDCAILCEYKNNSFYPLYNPQTDTVYVGGSVYDIIEYDGKIFFGTSDNINMFNLAYITDSSDIIQIKDTLRSEVDGLEVFKDTLFLSGVFKTDWQNAPANFFAYLDKSDYRVKPYGNNYLNSAVYDIKAYKNEMYAVGFFTATNTDSIYYVAKLDSVSRKWENVGAKGITSAGIADNMIVFEDKIFMAGSVGTIDTVKNCNGLVAWDGTKYKSYGLPGWARVLSMCLFKDKLTISGYDSLDYSFVYQLVCDTCPLGVFDGVKEINMKENWQIKVFPNPSDGNITLTCSSTEKVNYQIFDMQGKLVTEGSFKEKTKLSTGGFAKGSYKAIVKNKGEVLTKSLIVQ